MKSGKGVIHILADFTILNYGERETKIPIFGLMMFLFSAY